VASIRLRFPRSDVAAMSRRLEQWPSVQRETLDAWLDIVVSEAKSRAPEDTGEFRDSIQRIRTEILSGTSQRGGIVASARHASFADARTPTLEPAARSKMDDLDRMIGAAWERHFNG